MAAWTGDPNVVYTTSGVSNVSISWGRLRTRHLPSAFGWWGIFDALGHKLGVPQFFGPLPLMRIVCDHYEIAAGIPREDLVEMDYKGRAPWWLRA